MEKYLVTIEFRYKKISTHEYISESTSKTITIGVYNDFETACKNGNDMLETLESKFPLHRFPQGHYASKERFSKNGGCFGRQKTLITDLAYLRTPFSFFAAIKKLDYSPLGSTINEVVNSIEKYKQSKQ